LEERGGWMRGRMRGFGGGDDGCVLEGGGELNKGGIGGERDFGVFRRRGGCVCGFGEG